MENVLENKLIKRIKKDQLEARKNRLTSRVDILTALYSEIAMVGKNNGNRETTDAEAVAVIKKFKKGVTDSIESLQGSHNYENCSGRIDELREEINIYDEYLPTQFTEEQLRNILVNWKETNYPDTPNMGGYMSALKRLYDGQYDGKMASAILKEIL